MQQLTNQPHRKARWVTFRHLRANPVSMTIPISQLHWRQWTWPGITQSGTIHMRMHMGNQTSQADAPCTSLEDMNLNTVRLAISAIITNYLKDNASPPSCPPLRAGTHSY